MKRKMILLSMSMCTIVTAALAQDRLMQRGRSDGQDEFKRAYIGMGLGMDYGGLGFNAEFVPIKYLGIFAAGGYNFNGLGFNGGVSFKALPDCKITPTVIGMYGYNAVIVVAGATKYNKTYFGPSVGIGGELKVGRRDNKLKAAIFYPFRNSTFEKDYDAVKADPSIQMNGEMLPITYSIGFHFAL